MISRIASLPMQPAVGNAPFATSRFWKAQAVVWAAYGVAVTIPWIGRYTIASMVPNKLVIAGGGFIVSSTLGLMLESLDVRRARMRVIFAAAVAGAGALGALWSWVTGTILGGTAVHALGGLGVMGSAGPQLSGASYHALVLVAWSLGYLALTRTSHGRHDEQTSLERLLTRDGRKSLLLDPNEIDWIEADGDYVRIHAGARNLLVRERMLRLESTLPSCYVRIHRSAIVNVARIRQLVPQPNREYAVVLQNGTELKASRTYSSRLRTALGVGE